MNRAFRPTAPAVVRLLVATAAAVLAVTTGTAAPGRAVPTTPGPAAREAGITRFGDAYLGWRTEGGRTGPAGSRTGTAPRSTEVPVGAARVSGIDVSRWQGTVDWPRHHAAGHRFAYVKATEGSTYRSPTFAAQYDGAAAAGLVRGAYHFANPAGAGGAAQADFFVDHGGGWSADGRTLPGVLDVEFNPYGEACYGLTDAQMVSWIRAFTDRYRQRTGRAAVIYTNYYWWVDCTGSSTAFRTSNRLWVARYAATAGPLPGGWRGYTFWQYTDSPLDTNRFAGDLRRLRGFALAG